MAVVSKVKMYLVSSRQVLKSNIPNSPKTVDELDRATGVGVACDYIGGEDVRRVVIALLALQTEGKWVPHGYGVGGAVLEQDEQPHPRAQ